MQRWKEKYPGNIILDSDEDDAFLIDDNVRIIMKKFQEERRIIFDDIKSIDKLVGNITIYWITFFFFWW